MKNRLLTAACTFALALAGCNQPSASYSPASGSLAISRDDALLYAADSDLNALLVIDATTDQPVAKVAVGRQPEKVLVGADDTIYVTNRMSRSVSVISRGHWTEAARLDVGVEPVGLALSSDGKTLFVVNSTMLDDSSTGSLLAVDIATLQPKYEIAVGPEPRSVVVLGDRALVSLYKQGDLVTVDLKQKTVSRYSTALNQQLNQTALTGFSGQDNFGGAPTPRPPDGTSGLPTVRAHGFESMAATPDGKQVYVSALLASDATLPGGPATTSTLPPDGSLPPNGVGSTGNGYGGGSCGAGSVASPALLTFDAEGNSRAKDATICAGQSEVDQPPQVLSSGDSSIPLQGPVATAIDPTGAFTYVVNRESNNVAVVANATPESRNQTDVQFGAPDQAKSSFGFGGSALEVANVGAGPTGIALASDGARAWVYNAFDHTVSRLERKDGHIVAVRTTRQADDVLPADVVAGRKLFFSAVDARMSSLATGISCATCHLEGREDGNVWNFTDGPRQTPMLAGRMLAQTAPYHWNGEFQNFTSFMSHTVTHRMGGSVVTAAMESDLTAYINSLELPDNPNKKADGLTDAQSRGLQVFAKAECNSCHSGAALTDNKFADVGTAVVSGALVDNLPYEGKLNTPSLLGVARTAPYLHDGHADSLKIRILDGKALNRHGKTSQLTDAEVDDLVSYLKTL